MTASSATEPAGALVIAHDEGRVRILTLNRPTARNALSAALRTELIACLHEAENNGAIGAIVLTGAGTSFAAGADLKEMLARTTQEQRAFVSPPHIYSIVESLRKPVLAAINGHALGAGLELATACDVRIAQQGAKLGQPEITLGLIPGGGGTQRLVRLVGHGQASRLVLSGVPIDADEALRIGLVDGIVPAGESVVATAVQLAAAMAKNDAMALAAAKRALAQARGAAYEAGLAAEVEEFLKLHASPATKARIRAFLEAPKGEKAPAATRG